MAIASDTILADLRTRTLAPAPASGNATTDTLQARLSLPGTGRRGREAEESVRWQSSGRPRAPPPPQQGDQEDARAHAGVRAPRLRTSMSESRADTLRFRTVRLVIAFFP